MNYITSFSWCSDFFKNVLLSRYTSDVYVRAELMGLGEPKVTDTHKNVKVRAPGLFNYRLKWRCR